MIPLGKPKIDSLRIILPLSKVKINPDQMEFFNSIHHQETLVSTGETIEFYDQKTTYFNSEAPVSASYLFKRNDFFEGQLVDVIKIGFSSKLLRDFYFYGINKDTIKRCFDYINNEGFVTITKEDFLAAKVVDTDVCIDYYLQDTTCKEVVRTASELTIPRKRLITPAPMLKDTNVGIQWSVRNGVGRSYSTKQFLKYYAKALELKNNSTLFFDTYLKDKIQTDYIFANGHKLETINFFDEERLLRVETTIKNSDHWKTYDLEVITLRDLLSIDLTKNYKIFNRPIHYYMSGLKVIQYREELSPSEKMTLMLMQSKSKEYSINEVETIDLIVSELRIKDKSQKSKLRTKLYDLLTKNKTEEARNSQLKLNMSSAEMIKIGLIPEF